MIDIRRSLLYIITLHFLFGIILQSFITLPLNVVVWLLCMVFFCNVWSWYIQTHRLQIAIGIALISLCMGMLVFAIAEYRFNESLLSMYINESVELKGVITKEPTKSTYTQKLIVDIQEIVSSTNISIDEKILVYASLYETYSYGDEVTIKGKIVLPTNFVNDIGREVNYRHILKKDGIYVEIKKSEIEILSAHNGSFITEKLLGIKNIFVAKLSYLLPEPDASLAAGMLLGEKQSLGESLTDKLRVVGLIHIIVLSGYNIAIVAIMLEKIGGIISKKVSYVVVIAGIVFFVMMVGGGATVIRASIMAMLGLGTQIGGRSYNAGRALWIAAFVMVLINPFILLYDMSFQLSFLATLGIVYISPLIEVLWKSTKWKFVTSIIITTISTQIAVAPFLLYSTGSLSIVSLITNILVVPLTPILMASSFITALFGFIHIYVALPLSFSTHLLFSYMMYVVEFFSTIPFASLKNISLPLWGMICMYSVFVSIVIFCHIYYVTDTKKI